MRTISKHHKILAILLAAVILSTSIPLTIWGIGERNTITMENASEEDKRIASEISNETGAGIEEVLELKSYGRSWNEVLNILKNRSALGSKSEKNNRNDLLINSGLDEDFTAKLKKEGFSEQEILDAKLLEERVIFQLQEITLEGQANQVKIEQPAADNAIKVTGYENIAAYEELYKKINIEDAIYFMLKLKNEFGSYEKVFDEYLFSLQAELDLNEYIKDKEAYAKSRNEKELLIGHEKIITLEKIEEKSIENMQKKNNDSEDQLLTQGNKTTNKQAEAAGNSMQGKSPLPDVPKPADGDIKPKNPTDEIMNEIKSINPLEN